MPRRGRPISPITWLLAGQLLMFTGIAALFPVAALYVRNRGGSSVEVALFIAGPLVANMLAQVPAGHLADRIGRRPILIGSRIAFVAFSLALFADVGPLWVLATLRTLQGACSGAYVPALLAAITDLTPADRRAERLSQLQACELVGLLVGPMVGGVVALWRDNGIFLAAAVGVLLGLLVQRNVPETHGRTSRERAPAPPGWWRRRVLVVPALGLAALGAVFSMYDVVWPQYLAARGASTVVIGLSITLFAVPMLALATRAGRLSDRADRRVLLATAFAGTSVCCASYPFLHSMPLLIGIGCIEAVCIVVCEPSLYATLGDWADSQTRGRVMGLGGLFQFGGSAAGAAVLGSLYGVAEGVPFWCGSGLLILAAIISALGLPPRRRAAGPERVLAGPGAEGSKPAGLVVDGLEDGDDAGRPHVNRPLLAGKLDEVGGSLGDGDGREGLLNPEFDGDVAAIAETHDRHAS